MCLHELDTAAPGGPAGLRCTHDHLGYAGSVRLLAPPEERAWGEQETGRNSLSGRFGEHSWASKWFGRLGRWYALRLIAAFLRSQRPEGERLVIHVKVTPSVDDAQICAVPNVAWAAVAQGRKVSLLFDASAVTSVTRGRGPSKPNR